MRTASAKAKGRRLQQKVAERVVKALPGVEDEDVRSNPMGADGEDIWLSKAARTLFPFTIECKNVEKLSIWRAISQGRANQKQDWHIPAVVFSKNHEEPYIALPFERFMEIYEQYIKNSTD